MIAQAPPGHIQAMAGAFVFLMAEHPALCNGLIGIKTSSCPSLVTLLREIRFEIT
jgi:hypothetical protein